MFLGSKVTRLYFATVADSIKYVIYNCDFQLHVKFTYILFFILSNHFESGTVLYLLFAENYYEIQSFLSELKNSTDGELPYWSQYLDFLIQRVTSPTSQNAVRDIVSI